MIIAFLFAIYLTVLALVFMLRVEARLARTRYYALYTWVESIFVNQTAYQHLRAQLDREPTTRELWDYCPPVTEDDK